MGGFKGAVLGVNPDEYKRKLVLADAYRKNQLDQFQKAQQDIDTLLASKQVMDNGALRPLTPEEITDWTQKRQQVAQHIQNLYNPSFDPGRNMVPEDPIHKLASKIHLAKPRPAGEAKNAAQQKADLQGILQKATPAPGTELAQKAQIESGIDRQRIDSSIDRLRKRGVPEDELREIQTIMEAGAMGVPASVIRPPSHWENVSGIVDGKPVTLQHDTRTGAYTDLNGQPVPQDVLAKFVKTGTGGPKPIKITFHGNQAFMTDPTTGQVYSQSNISSAPQEVQTIFADAMKAAAAFKHTEGEHTSFIWQGDKQVPVQIHTETSSGFGPAAPPAGTPPFAPERKTKSPKPPGEQKKDIEAIRSKGKGNAGVVSVGEPVGYRKSTYDKSLEKEAGDTNASLESAIDRQSTMHKNLVSAVRDHDQQAMLSILTNHIGMTQGAQKGARITQTILDEAQHSAPWLQIIEAHWSPEGYLTGVVLPEKTMQQMVNLADEKVDTLKEHLKRSKEKLPGQNSSEMSDDDFLLKVNNAAKPAKPKQ